MALSKGNKALASDYNNVKNAINNAYTKIKGSAPSWNSSANIGAGTQITAAAINALQTVAKSAADSWVSTTAKNTTYNTNNTCGSNKSNRTTGSFSKAYRYWTKCGGQSIIHTWY